VQAGFIGPLPILNLGAGGGTVQAGFIGPIPILNLGAGEAAAVVTVPGHVASNGSPGGLHVVKVADRTYLKVQRRELQLEEHDMLDLISIIVLSGILEE